MSQQEAVTGPKGYAPCAEKGDINTQTGTTHASSLGALANVYSSSFKRIASSMMCAFLYINTSWFK